jgi:hypothetical protein
VRLIRMSEAARMLGISAEALRRRAVKGGDWVEIYGGRIRAYRIDMHPNAERRFNADEIARLLARLQKGRL